MIQTPGIFKFHELFCFLHHYDDVSVNILQLQEKISP